MSYTNGLDKPSDYFNTKLYSGDNATNQAVTGVGFKPDLVWIKARTEVHQHNWFDVIRGVNKNLVSNSTNAEATNTLYGYLASYDTDGFTTQKGSSADQWNVNKSGENYVAWNWLAGGTGVSNTQGSIASTVSANTTAGFSIVSWTGTGANGTVGHGLGTTPAMIITKARSSYGSDAWYVVHQKSWNNDGDGLVLSNTAGVYDRVTDLLGTGITAWSSSTFTINQGTATFLNNTSIPYIGYCWSEVKGFSKFGSYVGNGSATNATFVYTGFKPAFVIAKASSVNGYSWSMSDNKRNPFNQANNTLYSNASDAEYTNLDQFDLLSNGFKLKSIYGNTTGDTYIYMAFAESPFTTSTGIPATAR